MFFIFFIFASTIPNLVIVCYSIFAAFIMLVEFNNDSIRINRKIKLNILN